MAPPEVGLCHNRLIAEGPPMTFLIESVLAEGS